MVYFVALLIFILGYVVVKFLLSKVESLAGLAEVLGIIAGALIALLYLGYIA